MFQMSKLPKVQLKRILDEGQLRLLNDKFLEVRSYERVLKAQGYLAGEGPDVGRPAGCRAKEGPGRSMDPRRPIAAIAPLRTRITGQD